MMIGINKNHKAEKYMADNGLLGLMFSNTSGNDLPKRSLPVFAMDQPDNMVSFSSGRRLIWSRRGRRIKMNNKNKRNNSLLVFT